MATDFGFIPVIGGEHFFISYNTEDTDRVGEVARLLNSAGVPLWYDYCLEYGREWQRQIAHNIRSAKAVIMFITKGVFFKEKSYVREEYEIAEAYGIPVYCVMLDHIDAGELPDYSISWWLDIRRLHSVQCVSGECAGQICEKIMIAAGLDGALKSEPMLNQESVCKDPDDCESFLRETAEDVKDTWDSVEPLPVDVSAEAHLNEPKGRTGEKNQKDFSFEPAGSGYVINGYSGKEQNVVLPDRYLGNTVYGIKYGGLSNCTGLVSVVIPEGMISIGDKAFSWCERMVSISIPDSVTYIGDGAFNGCTRLESITIPDGVTRIGKATFRLCESLSSVSIPDSVTEIGEKAFARCVSLSAITIPDSVARIGNGAFSGCVVTVTAPKEASCYGFRPGLGVTWIVERK